MILLRQYLKNMLYQDITSEEISADTIDTAIQTVGVVALINNIKASNMTIEEMKLICDIDKIDYTPEEVLQVTVSHLFYRK